MYKKIIDEIRSKQYTPNNVKDAANKILSVNEENPPVKIVNICRNMGFSIFQQKLPEQICGYIAVDGELKDRLSTDRIISVNKDESPKRRRFTIAHELGHFLFGFKPDATEFYNAFELNHAEEEQEPDEDETLVNRFAAELLMPEDVFTKQYHELTKEFSASSEKLYEVTQALSDMFLVPPKAVNKRIKEELQLYATGKTN